MPPGASPSRRNLAKPPAFGITPRVATSDAFGVSIFTLAASGGFLLLALNAGRKRRLLDDTPVSKALGVFVGEVEVEGLCVRQDPYTSYLAERPCVLYSWSICEHWRRAHEETYTDDKGNTRTRTVIVHGSDVIASGGRQAGFYLQDETGFVWVEPAGADLETVTMFSEDADEGDALYYGKGPSEAVDGSTGQRTFSESGLPIGTKLFIRGRASERPDIVAAQIKREDKADMFIITPRGEKAVSDGKATAYVLWNIIGALCAGAFASTLFASHAVSPGPGPMSVGVLLYLVALSFGWVWMVFNSLVGVRNRVQLAQSLIDVQLKRRADLIPRLVNCLTGYRAHEASVLAMVARLRAEAASSGVSAVSPSLIAIQEQYPDLKAMDSFNSLSSNLIETEQRIALARNYYNDSVTFYNTRLERVPDAYVARIVSMQPAELFKAEGFERVAVGVKF
jgi:hypothetical protein